MSQRVGVWLVCKPLMTNKKPPRESESLDGLAHEACDQSAKAY